MNNLVPFITSEQMAEVDRLAVKNGLEIKQMMEYAGLNIARFVQRYVENGGSVLVLVGKGHNGGDGLAAARHLVNWGYHVRVVLAVDPSEIKETSRIHYEMLKKMNVDFGEFDDGYDVIVDSLLGYNIDGDPREKYAKLIEAANGSGRDILAIDLPSGLNGATGEAYSPCIEAKATLTLALPKTGLKEKSASKFVGELFVADLGIPEFIYKLAGIDIPPSLFKSESIISSST